MKIYHVKVGKQGRITLPIEVRRDLGLEEGDLVIFESRPEGLILRKATEEERYQIVYASKRKEKD
ncbi:MAG: AbrB/MazE/SpoVT family DNA-binding domain-containing protein [Thermomicrobiales bacterium]|nr:AbrB/MazE/SpoVT family DNA-binding domain-containing protein [Thermomicrobiales bacterium]MCO5219646.1 AbrB/MazE/SpoVT family DNA-binding domain-containing protein [Thermomicrobiales bacterium]MCO5226319.1 AbrB/MazE/SpoVT family DNA-binding domain-containing protein [Thermomicrobiales bacterium]MCO5228837.1 AbrB/MazE/SpoVT family DNA-binding domain-containing protein [Thermomicrobiales bacterium]